MNLKNIYILFKGVRGKTKVIILMIKIGSIFEGNNVKYGEIRKVLFLWMYEKVEGRILERLEVNILYKFRLSLKFLSVFFNVL